MMCPRCWARSWTSESHGSASPAAMLLGAVAGALLLTISLVPPLLAAAALALLVGVGYVPLARREV